MFLLIRIILLLFTAKRVVLENVKREINVGPHFASWWNRNGWRRKRWIDVKRKLCDGFVRHIFCTANFCEFATYISLSWSCRRRRRRRRFVWLCLVGLYSTMMIEVCKHWVVFRLHTNHKWTDRCKKNMTNHVFSNWWWVKLSLLKAESNQWWVFFFFYCVVQFELDMCYVLWTTAFSLCVFFYFSFLCANLFASFMISYLLYSCTHDGTLFMALSSSPTLCLVCCSWPAFHHISNIAFSFQPFCRRLSHFHRFYSLR